MPEAGNDSRNYSLPQVMPKSFLRAFSKPKKHAKYFGVFFHVMTKLFYKQEYFYDR